MPTKKMHICFIITRGDSIGGAQIHVRDLASALKNDGFRVTVFTGTTGDFTDQLSRAQVPWEYFPQLIRPIRPIKDLKAIIAVSRRLKELKPDLISCHTAKAGMIGRIAGLSSRIPSLFTAHGWQFADGIPTAQAAAVLFIEKIVSKFCRRVITVSDYDYQLSLRKQAVNKKKLITIHNGLPWLELPHRWNSEPDTQDLQSKPCRLIMVARFQEQKDHDTLFRALAGLKELPWVLELVGDGPGMEKAKETVRHTGIEPRTTFSGQQPDVPCRLENSDIFLLITNWEGFPRSIIEAMRAGLPVIVSDVGGCRESVIDGKTGFLVPRGDDRTLRKRIEMLIKQPDLRRSMGIAGRVRYEAEFTFQKMYNETTKLYGEIVSVR